MLYQIPLVTFGLSLLFQLCHVVIDWQHSGTQALADLTYWASLGSIIIIEHHYLKARINLLKTEGKAASPDKDPVQTEE